MAYTNLANVINPGTNVDPNRFKLAQNILDLTQAYDESDWTRPYKYNRKEFTSFAYNTCIRWWLIPAANIAAFAGEVLISTLNDLNRKKLPWYTIPFSMLTSVYNHSYSNSGFLVKGIIGGLLSPFKALSKAASTVYELVSRCCCRKPVLVPGPVEYNGRVLEGLLSNTGISNIDFPKIKCPSEIELVNFANHSPIDFKGCSSTAFICESIGSPLQPLAQRSLAMDQFDWKNSSSSLLDQAPWESIPAGNLLLQVAEDTDVRHSNPEPLRLV